MNPEALRSTMQVHDLGNVPSVAVSAVNRRQLDIGNNIHALQFHALSAAGVPLTRAQLIADIASIQIFLNSELIYDRTTTEALDDYLRDYSKFGALAAPLGVLDCPFVDRALPVYEQMRGGALGMLKKGSTPEKPQWNTLTYVLTMNAVVVTTAQIEIRAICDTRDPEATGMHIRRLRTTGDIAAVGMNHVNRLSRDMYGINAYHITLGAGNISYITVKKDNRYPLYNVHQDTMATLMDLAGKTPVATYQTILFNLTNDLNGCERLRDAVVDWDLQLTTTAAPGAQATILTEEVWDEIRE
jgi:hypothetical protein